MSGSDSGPIAIETVSALQNLIAKAVALREISAMSAAKSAENPPRMAGAAL